MLIEDAMDLENTELKARNHFIYITIWYQWAKVTENGHHIKHNLVVNTLLLPVVSDPLTSSGTAYLSMWCSFRPVILAVSVQWALSVWKFRIEWNAVSKGTFLYWLCGCWWSTFTVWESWKPEFFHWGEFFLTAAWRRREFFFTKTELK